MKITKKDYSAGKYKSVIVKTLKDFDRSDLVKRIWNKDATVWKDGKEYDSLIKNRLGWLSLPESMKNNWGDRSICKSSDRGRIYFCSCNGKWEAAVCVRKYAERHSE